MTVIPPGDYLQSQVPTIFAEEVPHSQQQQQLPPERQAGLVISKGALSAIGVLLVGMLIAAAAILYFQVKDFGKKIEAKDRDLAAASELTKKLNAENAGLSTELRKFQEYDLIEQYSKESGDFIKEINKDLLYVPKPPKSQMVPLEVPEWKGGVEKTLKDRRDRLQALSEYLKRSRTVTRTIDTTPGPGVIRPTQ